MTPYRKLRLNYLGPGIVMAGTAIGTSHLIQATRAGADYGFQLLIIIVLVNLLKYPFFEFGHRYPAATRENLLDGYARMGKGFIHVFIAFAAVSSIVAIATVTLVTAAIISYLFGSKLGTTELSALIMATCASLLTIGHYKWLDRSMKVIMAVLFLATFTAFSIALSHGPIAANHYATPSAWNIANLGFIIALMGWMPAPIEISVMQSLWLQAKEKVVGQTTNANDAKIDFNIGYFLTVTLAVIFLSLGALVMHGTGVAFASSGIEFTRQLVQIYRSTLGEWAGPIVGTAALATMFSTTLAVIDGYPRCLTAASQLVTSRCKLSFRHLYVIYLTGSCVPALLIINAYANQLTALIDLVTIMSFLIAPFFAFMNYKLIFSTHTPDAFQPGICLRLLSWCGLAFFIALGMLFLIFRFSPGLPH